MAKFSANLGFLWRELPLPDAIRAAANAKFDAVECHWPYDTPPVQVNAALSETGLDMLGLNTVRGDVDAGDSGLSALPGRDAEAREAIDQAIGYALAVKARNIHVMAGFAQGAAAEETFIGNLRYAASQAAAHAITILIEPLNRYDAPGYFLQTSDQAAALIETIGAANVKLMFDCYHLQIMEGDLTRRLRSLMPIIGHVQIAAVPSRGEPDKGEVDYRHIISELDMLVYDAPIGAEYRPSGATQDSLGWMTDLRVRG